jgi:hypothetical protein
MSGLVKIKTAGYAEYEALLLRRDEVRKEAQKLNDLYMHKFGELIVSVYQQKIECIQKKKAISFMMAALNQGKKPDPAALAAYLKTEMAAYQKELERLQQEAEATRIVFRIDDDEMAKIKKLYYKLAKLIHPDINPKTNDSPALKELWLMISAAYTANDLKELEEAEVLVLRILHQSGEEAEEVEIPDINEKIEALKREIEHIQSVSPYTYKKLLEDKKACKAKQISLQEELQEYIDYAIDLDHILASLKQGRKDFTWQMN